MSITEFFSSTEIKTPVNNKQNFYECLVKRLLILFILLVCVFHLINTSPVLFSFFWDSTFEIIRTFEINIAFSVASILINFLLEIIKEIIYEIVRGFFN